MLDHLIFDTTDATSIADSANVGAWVRAGDDGTLIGHVSDALKVNFSNTTIAVTQGTSPWVVSATDLDIRDLVFATDKVDVSGSSVSITGSVAVTQSTSPWVTQDAADHAEDAAHVSGDIGSFALAVRNDVEGSLVSANGDYAPLQVDALGRLRVAADIDMVTGSEKAEDSASASGDIGNYVLAVRQDTLATSTSADGDYGSFKTNALGALYVDIASSSGTLTVSDAALANTAIVSKTLTLAVADTAQAAVTTPLASRKYLWLYNFSNKQIYIGGATVSEANGFPISPGSYMELRAGAASPVNFVGKSGQTPEIRTLEAS